MKLCVFGNDFIFHHHEHVKNVAAIVSLSAAVAIFLKWFVQSSKRRKLRAKIDAFRRKEEHRREKINERIGSEDFASKTWIISLSFAELMAKLNGGELKAVEVLRAYQKAALNVTNEINAVTEFVENAEEIAEILDQMPQEDRRPLHGIPFSVKESFFLTGTEATCGHSQYIGFSVNFETAPIIEFLQWLGAIPFVKTNVPQAILSSDSRNPIFGVTKNPIDKTRGVGGSTGGEGALVGAKVSPFGIGSDLGGSVRIPAAWCGAYGLRPTSSRVLLGGDMCADFNGRILWRELFSFGFITQDISTLITLHRLLYSQATFDHFPLNQMAPVPFREDLLTSDQKLTIAFCDFDGVNELVPAVQRIFNEARQHLEKRGHHLVPLQSAFFNDEKAAVEFLKNAFALFINALFSDGLVDTVKILGNDVELSPSGKALYYGIGMPDWLKFPLRVVAPYVLGKHSAEILKNLWETVKTPQDVNILYRKIAEFRRKFCEIFESAKFDALLFPAAPFPAPPLDSARDLLPSSSYFALFNLLNWPAGVCPFGHVTAEDEAKMAGFPTRFDKNDIYCRLVKTISSSSTVGLPLSVQIAAPQFKEEIVLRLLKELSQ